MVRFELILVCPIHPKSLVVFSIDAKDEREAMGKSIGERAFCNYPPGHSFVIHAENIIGWQPVTPTYMPAALVEKEARRPPEYVPPPPTEKMYYVDPQLGLQRIMKTRWWEK